MLSTRLFSFLLATFLVLGTSAASAQSAIPGEELAQLPTKKVVDMFNNSSRVGAAILRVIVCSVLEQYINGQLTPEDLLGIDENSSDAEVYALIFGDPDFYWELFECSSFRSVADGAE